MKDLAVVSLIGEDHRGVVARYTSFLAERGVNIEDLDLRVVGGIFLMDMLVDLKELTLEKQQFLAELNETAEAMGMEVRVHFHRDRKPKSIAVLVSKEPHCLRQLISDVKSGVLPCRIATVLSNHPHLEHVAADAGIPFAWKGADDLWGHFEWLHDELQRANVELVVLARYMRILPPPIVHAYAGRIINIHPSLLPYFPGATPYRQAFDSGVRVHGCTAHFVTEQLDEGPVILQDVFRINVGVDTPEDVRARGLQLEGQVLSRAVRHFLDEELVIVDGKVIFKPGISRFLGRGRES